MCINVLYILYIRLFCSRCGTYTLHTYIFIYIYGCLGWVLKLLICIYVQILYIYRPGFVVAAVHTVLVCTIRLINGVNSWHPSDKRCELFSRDLQDHIAYINKKNIHRADFSVISDPGLSTL
jgi:hypothetical protein